MKKNVLLSLAVAGLLPWVASGTQVPVQDPWGSHPPGGGEWNLYNSGIGSGVGNGIMEYLYGVGNFTRLDDSALIQWSSAGTSHSVGITAVYAGAQQNLYTATPGTGSPISPVLVPVTGNNATPSRFLSNASFTPVADPFLFLDQANGNMAYSDPALNTGHIDRMVAFSVSGYLATAGVPTSFTAFSQPTYVLAFEDGSDADYQDLVVEVNGVANVPDAGFTVALLGMGMLGLGGVRRVLKLA